MQMLFRIYIGRWKILSAELKWKKCPNRNSTPLTRMIWLTNTAPTHSACTKCSWPGGNQQTLGYQGHRRGAPFPEKTMALVFRLK